MKAKESEAVKGAEFRASHGWFDRFKRRSNLHNIKMQGEAAAAENCLRDLVAIRKMKFLMLMKRGCSGRSCHDEPLLQKRRKPCQASSQIKIG
jgi:hypothetical protein